MHEVRFALRLFARQRGFFVTTILTIALGVGLTATVFAIVDGVLFRPLPYQQSDRLVALFGASRAEQQLRMPLSLPDLVDWRAGTRAFERIEAYDLGRPGARVRGTDASLQAPCTALTEGFFALLGTRAALGRTFAATDYAADATPVAMITHRLWLSAFGGEPSVLGRSVGVGVSMHAIVGVLPRDFVFPNAGRRFAPDVLVPLTLVGPASRTARQLWAIGRLAPGVSMQQAQTEMDGIALRLKPLFPANATVVPGAFDGVTLTGLRDELTRASRAVLWLVFGAVATVFLIACVNVLGLLLAHGEARKRELSVRIAIGAGRAALARQLLAEAALLAAAGGLAGWIASTVLFHAVTSRIPRWLQLLGEPRLDARAAAMAGILALVTVGVAGVIPLLRAWRLTPQLAAAGSRQATSTRRSRHVLILLEVALATLLLCAGSIMLRSWIGLHAQETGIDARRVIALRTAPPGSTDAPARARHQAAVAGALRRVAGISAVEFADAPLLQRTIRGSRFVPPALVRHPAGMDTDVTVSPGYFEVMGMAVLRGRSLRAADLGRSVVVNASLARRYWPGRDAVGETVRYGNGTRDIVGVVSDARDYALDYPAVPTLYHAWDDSNPPAATLVLRFSGPAGAALAGVRRAVRAADDGAAITMLSTVEDLLSVSVAERSFNTLLFVTFGGAGLLVALVGIYGLVAFVVTHREREMGIRLALGATGRGVRMFVMAGTLRWVAAGLAAGIAGSLLCAQYLEPFVYQVEANDPSTIAAVAVGFLAIAALAAYLPARRASRADPMLALRAE